MLGHDTHGHELQSRTGCRGFLQTDANDASHGGNVFGVISAELHRQGRRGRRAAADDDQPGPDAPEAPGGRARRHAVRARTRPPTPTAARGVHRSSLANDDWIQLNGPFNLFQIDSVDVPLRRRPADGHDQPRVAGSPLAAIEVRTGSQTGPIVTTLEPDRRPAAPRPGWCGRARRSRSRWPGKHELFLVFRVGHRRRDGQQPVHAQLGRVQRQRRDGASRRPRRATSAAACRRRCRCRSGTPASFGAFTPGVARTYDASTTANVISTRG